MWVLVCAIFTIFLQGVLSEEPCVDISGEKICDYVTLSPSTTTFSYANDSLWLAYNNTKSTPSLLYLEVNTSTNFVLHVVDQNGTVYDSLGFPFFTAGPSTDVPQKKRFVYALSQEGHAMFYRLSSILGDELGNISLNFTLGSVRNNLDYHTLVRDIISPSTFHFYQWDLPPPNLDSTVYYVQLITQCHGQLKLSYQFSPTKLSFPQLNNNLDSFYKAKYDGQSDYQIAYPNPDTREGDLHLVLGVSNNLNQQCSYDLSVFYSDPKSIGNNPTEFTVAPQQYQVFVIPPTTKVVSLSVNTKGTNDSFVLLYNIGSTIVKEANLVTATSNCTGKEISQLTCSLSFSSIYQVISIYNLQTQNPTTFEIEYSIVVPIAPPSWIIGLGVFGSIACVSIFMAIAVYMRNRKSDNYSLVNT